MGSKYFTKNALQVTSEKNTPENRKTDNYIKTTVNNTSVKNCSNYLIENNIYWYTLLVVCIKNHNTRVCNTHNEKNDGFFWVFYSVKKPIV